MPLNYCLKLAYLRAWGRPNHTRRNGCKPARKIKFSIKNLFNKCDQIWLHLLKKSLMKNFIFCLVKVSMKKLFHWKQQSLRKILKLQQISWCGNFVETQKVFLLNPQKPPYHEIKWHIGILRIEFIGLQVQLKDILYIELHTLSYTDTTQNFAYSNA